jgi:hypothetical protein
MAEDGQSTAERPSEGVESWLELPAPSATHDLDELRNFSSGGYDIGLMRPYFALRDSVREATLQAMRECTNDDGFVYAVEEPEGTFRCFRFWPHRAYEGMAWLVEPMPRGGDRVIVSDQFTWGLYATRGFDTSVDWALSIFGQPLIDALRRLQLAALTRVIRIDRTAV